LPWVKEINFAGGESTITQDHYEILNKLIANKKFDVRLRYVTNLSVMKYKDMNFDKVWPQMNKVDIVVSLDEVESRGEYWRHGLNWSKFVENVKTLISLTKQHSHISMSYGVTVSVFNILRLTEIVNYLLDNDMLDSTISIDFNSALSCTSHLDITSMPDESKIITIKNIEELITRLHDKNINSTLESVKNKLIGDYSINSAVRQTTAENFAKLDIIRNQSLKDVAPELYEIYSQYGYDRVYATFKPHEIKK
jgi:hypothetical protein